MPTPSSLRTPIAAPDIAARLRLSATRLARRLRQESGAGLSPSQQSALAVIANHGPLTLGALAEHERVAPPSITKVVSKLECDGLVTRTAFPTIPPRVDYALTKLGHSLLEPVRGCTRWRERARCAGTSSTTRIRRRDDRPSRAGSSPGAKRSNHRERCGKSGASST